MSTFWELLEKKWSLLSSFHHTTAKHFLGPASSNVGSAGALRNGEDAVVGDFIEDVCAKGGWSRGMRNDGHELATIEGIILNSG